MNVITTKNLTKYYAKEKVVSEVTLDISKGTVFGFLGPNGAGKTTTIRMLLGLVTPSSGTAKLLGCDVKSEYIKVAKDIAAIVESPTFFPYLNAIQTLQTFADYCNLERSKNDLEKLLDKCGILSSANKRVDNFSLGMKQRLGLAIALLNNPKVIFLDEPTNGLDPSGIVETRKLIRQFADEENRTVFISSHLLNEIEQICDEVAIINKGKIKVCGKVSNLLKNKRIILNAKPINETNKIIQEIFPKTKVDFDEETENFSFDVDSNLIPHLIEKLVQNKISVYQIFQSNQTLEDFFHQTIKDEEYA